MEYYRGKLAFYGRAALDISIIEKSQRPKSKKLLHFSIIAAVSSIRLSPAHLGDDGSTENNDLCSRTAIHPHLP
jgi:hypothetical protein